MKRISKEKRDILQEFVALLRKKKIPFCVIGGLAVNAYTEPVVSLDLDLVVVADRLEETLQSLKKRVTTKKFPNSVNISCFNSDVRIQIQTDPRYQDFISRAAPGDILGYKLPVAKIEDVIQGKIWAAQDETRRPSKRQKDLADILRLVEAKRALVSLIPYSLRRKLSL